MDTMIGDRRCRRAAITPPALPPFGGDLGNVSPDWASGALGDAMSHRSMPASRPDRTFMWRISSAFWRWWF